MIYHSLKSKIFRGLKSSYLKNISTQVIGSGFAQILPLLIMPFLARIYSAEEFAGYTSFMAIIGILSVAVGGRYYMAIVLPKTNEEANSVFTLSIFLTLIYSIVLLLFVLIYYNFFKVGSFEISYLIIPFYIFFYGVWLSLINFSIRLKKFKVNAFSKIFQSFINSISTISFGLIKLSSGLIIGRLVGILSASIFLKFKFKKLLVLDSVSNLKFFMKKYKNFPIYGILPSFLDAASLQAPVFAIEYFFTKEILGHFGLTIIVLSAPLSVLSVAFKDVFYQKVAELYNLGDGFKIRKVFLNSAILLLIIGIPFGFIVHFFGESIFSIIFGKEWIKSGKYAEILIFSFIIKLVVSPLSSIFNIFNKQRIISLWQGLYFITTLTTIFLSVSVFKLTIDLFLVMYVSHELVLYLTYFYLQLNLINKNQHLCVE
tara:strand:- start:506 stop:1792 length:1287 start_codon:yes stop_codon:yes gene_type:complete